LIWSGSERISEGPLSSGLRTAGGLLVQHLARDARCQQRPKTKEGRR
jgi:hypothetical protein